MSLAFMPQKEPKKTIHSRVAVTNSIELMSGAHIIYLYKNKEPYLNNALSFISTGLDMQHAVVFIDTNDNIQVILKRLKDKGYKQEELENLVFLDAKEYYTTHKIFNATTVYNTFLNAVEPFLKKGLPVRIWGNVLWTGQHDMLEALALYEHRADSVITDPECFTICAYNANKLPANFLLELMKCHPYMMTDTDLFTLSLYRKNHNTPAVFIQENLGEALKASELRIHNILRDADIGVALISKYGKICECNSKFADILGYSVTELCTMNLFDCTHPTDKEQSKKHFTQLIKGESKNYKTENRFIRQDGEVIWVSVNLLTDERRRFIIMLFEDITERKKMEQQLYRLENLNTIGKLAAGISHEIRNPLTTIRGFLQMLSNKKEYATDKNIFHLMISELDRANSIITEFLSLSRNKPSELKMQSLNNIIETLAPLLQADALEMNKYIAFQLSDIPDLPLNDKEIRQVILNLVRNGLEAMESKGKITICTRVEDRQVILSISDEGPGIPADLLDKIGTPFFTTKENGTGLGLAICYSIIERHNGKIEIDTGSNGTTFSIVFPHPKCS